MDKSAQYYLQVVPNGESVVWSEPEEELLVSSQEVEGGFTQYWAYPKSANINPETQPHAQKLASQISTPKPVILIDQTEENLLELILVKSGVAFAKTDSNLTNLEDNLTEILDYGKNKFNIKVDNFMTTSRVTPDIEQKLDELEGSENVQSQPDEIGSEQNVSESVEPEESESTNTLISSDTSETDSFQNLKGVDPARVFRSEPTLGGLPASKKKSSNMFTWLLILVLVGGLGFAGYAFRGKLTALFAPSQQSSDELSASPSPTPTPEATPEPLVRSEYSVKVLNGTTTTGLAADLADKLKEVGWDILPVGNNSDRTVAQTTIKVKLGQDMVAEKLIEDLASDYEATRGADLAETSTSDAEVIIGKK